MGFAEQVRSSYDAVAGRYTAEVAGELVGKPLDRALLDMFAELAAGGPVVDAGCGPGHVAARIGAVGLDLSPAMCAQARAAGVPAAAADMTALPVASGSVAGVVSFYAVIHLPDPAAAYREFARVVRPGGHLLLAFHESDAETGPGRARRMTEWWGEQVDLDFHFLDPAVQVGLLEQSGWQLVARVDREAIPGVEHASRRCYLLAQR
ncbi:methyltransferase domain-containing protein [Nakamurella sp. YIM 132087]|uniref:Methyltransferase domain-containing protein n=1 Tax=Nakamurella alba TaxID=2665158 RepID=A0A7K1FRB5_9ACTN|nr:class I SAM-dependent methyltransferase [Nakamurella alba]MTD16692.1 methyltransferase domain-containing protein [Nakamurella alba]